MKHLLLVWLLLFSQITYAVSYEQNFKGIPPQTYASFATFPTLAPDGALAVDTATHNLYVYNLGTASWDLVTGGGGGGSVNSVTATAPVVSSGGADPIISMAAATSLVNGYLSSANFVAFNSKEPGITAGTSAQYWRGDKTFQTLDTSVVPENTNLYYTAARFNTAFAAKSTTDLAEGTNLYYTALRAKSDAVADAIVNGVTDVAPSQNAVFDALALKAAATHTHVAADVTDFDTAAKTAAVADAISNGVVDVAPSQNAVFDALALKEALANKDTDNTLAADSDTKYPSQKAIKSYVDTGLGTKEPLIGFTPENVANKDTDVALTANSDTRYPSQKAIKAYADGISGSKWNLAGNSGTGGTAILGTTDAQPFSIRSNNTNIITFSGTNPALSSSVSQAPADGIGLNQFDWRVYIDPTASTTNASHTGTYSQLVYDNGNAGFDSTGGSYFASSANFTHNGSGDLGAASIFSGGASFNSAGTTGQFKGVTSESIIDTGATVTDFQGMTSGLNTTGGIVPASNSLSLYGNFTDATIGNASNISSNLSFSGTTANSQGVNAISTFTQFNDSATTTNGVNGINAGIDLNDTAAVTGINASNIYVNMRDTATHGGLNLYNAGLNQQDSAVNTGGVNGFSANLQFTNTSDTAGVTLFNGYARTDDTAHLDSLTGIQINPEIQGSSDVDNVNIADFSGQIRGSSTVDNLTGVNVGPQMSGSATVTNFMGMNVNPQVNGTSTLTNGLTGIQLSPSGTVPLNQVTALNINTSGVTLTPSAFAAGGQVVGINNDGAFSSGYNYTVPGAAGFFQINYLGGGPIVANGDPTSAFGFGNNLAHSVTLHDDWNLDPSGLGFVDVGFVGSLGFDTGTTMASWTGALGGAGNPSGAGTLTTAKMFSAAGILPQGGSLAVTNMYGFEVNPNLFCLVGTNCWGFFEDTAAAENHVSKLAIGTASKKVVNSSTALEIGNSKGFVNGRGDTATKNALTAAEGMQFYDTDLSQLQVYDGASWVSAGGYTPPSESQEVPSGTIDNSNDTFTLANTPVSNASVKLYQDGLIMVQGTDYTISGSTITMTIAPNFGQTLYANYSY